MRAKLSKIKAKLVKGLRIFLGKFRKRKLTNRDFTILSNNCWGGLVYQHFDMSYATPTVGLFIFPEDYLRFLNRLEYYLSLPMQCIPAEQSKYYEALKSRNQLPCPVGKLDDIEIIFLHYKSDEEAISKWEKRKKRVNLSNLIVKNAQMNYCTQEQIEAFDALPFQTKFMFVNKPMPNIKSAVYFPGYETDTEVRNDTNEYGKYIDLYKLINEGQICPKNQQ